MPSSFDQMSPDMMQALQAYMSEQGHGGPPIVQQHGRPGPAHVGGGHDPNILSLDDEDFGDF